MPLFRILLKTPKKKKAGTDADVQANIVGSKWKSGWVTLDNPGDDREQGSYDYYWINYNGDLGTIKGVELRVKRANEDGPEWLLESVYLNQSGTTNLYKFPYNQWINPTSYTEWVYITLANPQVMNVHNTMFGEPRPWTL